MKLLTFTKGNPDKHCLGALINDKVLDLNLASKNKLPSDMLAFIYGQEEFLNIAKELIKKPDSNALYSLAEIKIKAPILTPPSLKDFFAFEEHAKAGAKRRNEELPKEWYEIPAYYKGNHRAIFGPEDEILWPYYTKKLDFECEIACVIGKKGINIPLEDAEKYIFGYMIFNDFSARDIQKKKWHLEWDQGKVKTLQTVLGLI